jgi:uncharacterized repeat protein (TIGR01451 family)
MSVVCKKNGVGSVVSGGIDIGVGENINCQVGYTTPSSGSVSIGVIASSATPEPPTTTVYQNTASISTRTIVAKIDVFEAVGHPNQTGALVFEVPYEVSVWNVPDGGTSPTLEKIQVDNSLVSTFGNVASGAQVSVKAGSLRLSQNTGGCVINGGYDGNGDTRLLDGNTNLVSGKSCEIRFTAVVDYTNAGRINTNTLMNESIATGFSPGTGVVNPGVNRGNLNWTKDESADVASVRPASTVAGLVEAGSIVLPVGMVPNGDGSAATPVRLVGAKVDVVMGAGTTSLKDFSVDANTGENIYTYEIPVSVLVGVASGAGYTYGIQVNQPMKYEFIDGSLVGVSVSTEVVNMSTRTWGSATSACTANRGFNGDSDTRLLQGTDTMKEGEGCVITYTAQITYRGVPTSQTPRVYPMASKVFGMRTYGSSVSGGAGVNNGYTFSYTSGSGVINKLAPSGATSTDESNDIGGGAMQLPSSPGGDDGGSVGTNVSLGLPDQTVSGLVYTDVNGNGAYDAGEGVSGILVDVVDAGGDQITRGMTRGVTRATYGVTSLNGTTNSTGNYTINNIPPGTWTFRYRRGSNGVILASQTGVPVLLNNSVYAAQYMSAGHGGLVSTSAVYAAMATQTRALVYSPAGPMGYVYDALTKDKYGGVKVYLSYCGTSGQTCSRITQGQGYIGNGEENGVVTDSGTGFLGAYNFNFTNQAPAGVYQMTLDSGTLPAKTSFPSDIIGAEVDLNRTDLIPVLAPINGGVFIASPVSLPIASNLTNSPYYTTFRLTTAGVIEIENNHIPLDREFTTQLYLRKEGDRKDAELGDTVLYRITVRASPYALNPVTVVDTLPLGFKLISGTVKRSDGKGGMVSMLEGRDVEGAPGPVLKFKNLYLAHNTDYNLEYRVRVNVGADRGTGTNSAYAMMGKGGKYVSQTSRVKIEVRSGVFTKEACIFGKVYIDCNGDNQQNEGEMGIPGVNLYMEDGLMITTDNEGQYSFCGLKPITHVIRVDERTLPEGSKLGEVDARNTGNASSRFVDVKDGELHRADFREMSCSTSVLRRVRAKVGRNEEKAKELKDSVKGRRGSGKGLGRGRTELIPEGNEEGGIDFRSEEGRGCEENDVRVVCDNKAGMYGPSSGGVEVRGVEMPKEGLEGELEEEEKEGDIPEREFVSPEDRERRMRKAREAVNLPTDKPMVPASTPETVVPPKYEPKGSIKQPATIQ